MSTIEVLLLLARTTSKFLQEAEENIFCNYCVAVGSV